MNYTFTAMILLLFNTPLFAQKGFKINNYPEKEQVDIIFNDQLLTSYCYYDSIAKPFLFPVNTIDGITVTRGYPIRPQFGERTDHPHHTGIWFNYESVNGIDFWNNSTAIASDKKDKYGSIKHEKIIAETSTANDAFITATANWHSNNGTVFLKEKSRYHFMVKDSILIIDRFTQLTTVQDKVVFKDVKDGLFAFRVARELEMPSTQSGGFIDSNGNKTNTSRENQILTGIYYNSNHVKGDSVWGTKATWCMLNGEKEGKHITIAILDHHKNTGYPSYWHARGYGLFAINPLGNKAFNKNAKETNLILIKNQNITFKYRIIIASKDLNYNVVDYWFKNFQKQ